MSVTPTPAELTEAISAILVTSPHLETDVEAIVTRIQDDHFLWKVDPSAVAEIVEHLVASKPKPISKPEKLFKFNFGDPSLISIPLSKSALKIDDKLKIFGIHHAQGGLGSLGVFLINMQTPKSAIVLKQKTDGIYSEIFANEFISRLGFKTPETRILNKREFETLEELLRPAPVTVRGTCMQIHMPGFKEQGAVLMEFLHGKELTALKELNPSDELLMAFLFDLGKLIAMDTIINNTDRTPFLRRGEGNAGNILISNSMKINAIDQMVNVIRSDKLLHAYLDGIKSFRNSKNLEFRSNEVRKVLEFIETNSGVKVGNDLAEEQLKRGIDDGFDILKMDGANVVKDLLGSSSKLKATIFPTSQAQNAQETLAFLTATFACL